MGLAQKFCFTYKSIAEVDDFINKFSSEFNVSKQENGLYEISQRDGIAFSFELTPEDYGLYTHRSGEYFYFLGLFLERLTGLFGTIEVEDK